MQNTVYILAVSMKTFGQCFTLKVGGRLIRGSRGGEGREGGSEGGRGRLIRGSQNLPPAIAAVVK